MRDAGPALYFIRVPSLPATDDGDAKPLSGNPPSGPGELQDTGSDNEIAPGDGAHVPAARAAEADGGCGSADHDGTGVAPGAGADAAPHAAVAPAPANHGVATAGVPRSNNAARPPAGSGPGPGGRGPGATAARAGPGGAGRGNSGRPRRRVSRRTILAASLIGGAGVAALPLATLVGGSEKTSTQPTSLALSMNTNWLFGGQYVAGSESAFYDDSDFAPVSVPHTVTPLSWQNWDYQAWQQLWTYRRHFSGARLLDPHQPGNRIFVDFDGVMVNASVSLNDQPVRSHQGGYLPFSAELTGKVRAGHNLLAVVVDSRCLPVPPVGVGSGPLTIDFFQPGGIYRDVTIRVVPEIFLSDLYASPADVLTSQPRVDIECTVDSATATRTDGSLLIELLDGDTQILAQAQEVQIGARGASVVKLSLTGLGPVALWSPDIPKLYTVRATLSFPGLGSHALTRRIGFRQADFQPEGFFLNGKRLQLFGLNRHQLYPYAGMAMPAGVQRKDAEILKTHFNCNMVRCSHYPQSPHFLDACDELGLLVWEEAPGWHAVSTAASWQDMVIQDVRDMVIRDRSRPSVIIWGTRLNETAGFPALWTQTRAAARELDATRPSSGAMYLYDTHGWDEDVYAFNDYGIDPKTHNAQLRPPIPGVPYLITESVGVEEIKPEQFTWTSPPALLARQAMLHAQAQSHARSDPAYSGLLGWAGFDYASELSQDPDGVKWAGVADGFRVPKPAAGIYQSQVDPSVRPVIIPVFFWENGGAVPAPAPTAMIASNCERLEIFIGAEHVASAQPALGSPLYGGLSYPPFLVRLPRRTPAPTPDLLIEGFVGGQQMAELRMSANLAGDALGMAVDHPTISADGSDATRAVFRAIDAYGNQRRYASGTVTLSLSGPATLVGDNPFAFGQYGGLGAAWIRSLAGQPGAITLTASHPLLGQAEVQVRSEQADQATWLE
jgi:beta-galactosidase